MTNLLKTDLKILFKKFNTRFSLILYILLGIVVTLLNKSNDEVALTSIFSMYLLIIIITSAIIGMFLSKDFTEKTIINKIIVGHKRSNIYLSKFLSTLILYIVSIALFTISYYISTRVMIGDVNTKKLLTGLLVSLFVTVATSSITTFIVMIVREEVSSLMPSLFYVLVLIGVSLSSGIISEKIINSLYNVIPFLQLLVINVVTYDKKILFHIISSIIITIIFYSSGYLIFKKTDLK